MAAGLVRRERLLPLARIQSLQNARAGVALSLPRLYALPSVWRQTIPARLTSLPLRLLDARRFLPAPDSRRPSAHRIHRAGTVPAQKRSAPPGLERSVRTPQLPR